MTIDNLELFENTNKARKGFKLAEIQEIRQEIKQEIKQEIRQEEHVAIKQELEKINCQAKTITSIKPNPLPLPIPKKVILKSFAELNACVQNMAKLNHQANAQSARHVKIG